MGFGDRDTYRTIKPNCQHIYSNARKFPVNLTVTDNDGDQNTKTLEVNVKEPLPEAIGTYFPDEPKIGDVITFDASQSKDKRGRVIDYEWDFGDGYSGKRISIKHQYLESGIYNVTLVVINDKGIKNSSFINVDVSPKVEPEFKQARVGDLLINMDINPAQVPAYSADEIVRLNITLTNSNSEDLTDVKLQGMFPSGKLIRLPKASLGKVKVIDIYSGEESQPLNAFSNGSLLLWNIDQLDADKSASLTMEVEVLYPMSVDSKQRLYNGITITYSSLKVNVAAGEKNDWPITKITYPSSMIMGMANISWNVERSTSFTAVNIFTPTGLKGTKMITDTQPGKRYSAVLPLLEAGTWKFNIEAGDGYTHQTDNYSIEVRSIIPSFQPYIQSARCKGLDRRWLCFSWPWRVR